MDRALFLDLSLAWAFIALLLLLQAWRYAVQGNIRRHRLMMLVLTLAAWVFVISYLLISRSSGQLSNLSTPMIVWLSIHGSVGLLPLFGAVALILARALQGLRSAHKSGTDRQFYLNRHHRFYGRIIMVLWVFTHLGGIANYFLLH
jgi:uncharacterized membrane protein YozB (DUF420 family)